MFNILISRIKGSPLLRNSAIFSVGAFITSLGSYLFHFLMARMLSVQDYGELQSLIALLSIFGIPASALTMVIIKYTAAFSAKKDFGKIQTVFIFFTKKLLFVGLAVFAGFSLLSKPIADFLQIGSAIPLIILSSNFLLVFLSAVIHGVLQGAQKFKSLSIISIITVALKVLMAVILVKVSFALSGAIGGMILSGIIGYFISFVPLKFLFEKDENKNNFWLKFKDLCLLRIIAPIKNLFKMEKYEEVDYGSILKYSLPAFFTLLFTTLFINLDIVLVKHFMSPVMAGEYGALAVIGHIIFFVSGPIITVMFPMVAKAYANGGRHGPILKNSFLLITLINFIALASYFILPGLVIKILVGAKFLSVAPYLGWFGLAMFFYSLIYLLSNYLLSIHLTKYIYILGSGLLLQLSLICLWHASLWQIVLIMNATLAATLGLLLIFTYQKLKVGKSISNK